jgi:hypothetical protein
MALHLCLLDLNSGCIVITTIALQMLSRNEVVLSLGKRDPITDSIVGVLMICLPEISVACVYKVGDDLSDVLDLVGSVTKHNVAVVITSNIESIVGGCWSNEPSLVDTSDLVSDIVLRFHTQR